MGGAPALRVRVRVRVRGPPGERVREEGAQCLGCRRLGPRAASSAPCWGNRGWPGVQRTNRQSQGAWPLFCTLLFLKHYRPQTCCFPSPLVSLAPGLVQPNARLCSMGFPGGELTLLRSRPVDILVIRTLSCYVAPRPLFQEPVRAAGGRLARVTLAVPHVPPGLAGRPFVGDPSCSLRPPRDPVLFSLGDRSGCQYDVSVLSDGVPLPAGGSGLWPLASGASHRESLHLGHLPTRRQGWGALWTPPWLGAWLGHLGARGPVQQVGSVLAQARDWWGGGWLSLSLLWALGRGRPPRGFERPQTPGQVWPSLLGSLGEL